MFDRLYIELENDSVRYIHGSVSGKKANIRKWGRISLRQGCFINGKVVDELEFIKSLSALRTELGIFRSTVHLTVNDGSFITRPIELPILKEKDIDKHLALEAEQYLPINKKNFMVDFRIIGRRTELDESGSSVMVSAGPKESIENTLKCFDASKLDVKVIDVYPNNICRLFNDFDEEDFAIIDMGRKSINITIMENKRFYMHTFIPVNMELLFEDYIKGNNLGMEEFRQKCFYKGFDMEQAYKDEAPVNDNMRAALSNLMGQVSRYLDYFNSRHFGKTVDNVYVIGENGLLRGLRSMMSYSFNTKVTIGMKPSPVLDSIRKDSFLEVQMGYYGLLGMMLRGKKL